MEVATAADVISDAALELGLVATAIENPYASSDQNILQLCALLKGVGKDLARKHSWTHLQKTHTFSTADGVEEYVLPADFARLVDGTYFNRSNQSPLGGPASSQAWSVLKGSSAVGTYEYFFRVTGNRFVLHPVPSSVGTIAFEYQSSWWVGSDLTAPTGIAPSSGTGTLWFDARLLVAALKLAFLRAKGFDSTAVQDDYDSQLSTALGADGAAPTLSLNPRTGPRFLDECNIPETGFGS